MTLLPYFALLLVFYTSFSAGFSDPRFHYATTMVRTPHYSYKVTSTYACPNFTSVEQAAAKAGKIVDPEPDPELEAVLEYTKKIGEATCTVSSTLTDIGEIALNDDPKSGAMIIAKLQDQVSEGSRIFGEFTASTGQRGGNGKSPRVKRQASEAGNAALNKVGDVLAGITGLIDAEISKLSAKAKKKISKKHKDGLDKCRADSCRAAAKLLASGDDDDRQK